MKKLLITGSTGFIGNFLADYFANQGLPVVGIDVRPHPYSHPIPNFTFYECDVRSQAELEKIFRKEKPTHVIHLASSMAPLHDHQTEYNIDVVGSKNIIKLANDTPTVRQFIKFNSTSIYGADKSNKEYFNEEDVVHPRNYQRAIAEKEVEEFCQQFPKRDDLKLVILRLCTVVGPSYHAPGGLVSNFSHASFAIQVGFIPNSYQFLYEDDVKKITELIIKDREIEGTYNLTNTDKVTVQQLAAQQKKRVFYLPLWLLKLIFGFCWLFRIKALKPSMAKLVAFPIVASPQKLFTRYKYQPMYNSARAFEVTVKERREKNVL